MITPTRIAEIRAKWASASDADLRKDLDECTAVGGAG